jgi:hypothetical protein
MAYESVRHKLSKYQNKMTLESNQYKKALYAEKVGYYHNMLQSGGGLSEIIDQGAKKLKDEIGKIKGVIPQSTLSQDQITKLKDGITKIQALGQYKDDTLGEAIAFAKYNAEVRETFRQIQKEVETAQPLNKQQLDDLQTLSGELDKFNLLEIQYNVKLAILLGVLQGSKNDELQINKDIGEIENELSQKRTFVIYQQVKNYSNDVQTKLNDLDVVKKNEKNVKTNLDGLVAKINA